MKTADTLPTTIDEYATGRHMKVNGRTYTQDLKIVGDTVKGNWWRREGHRLAVADIADILDATPGHLVVGTGYAGRLHISKEARRHLLEAGIRLISERTSLATEIFNRLRTEGKNVAGAFHLTC